MSRSASRVYKPFSFQCSPLIRGPKRAYRNSRESFYTRDSCHSEQGFNFQDKTSFWEGDPPSELTVPQTDTDEQVEYTKALERTMLKELDKMTP